MSELTPHKAFAKRCKYMSLGIPVKKHPLYWVWRDMIKRCLCTHHKFYKDYGARGIRVCNRWADFTVFISDMGDKPSKSHSLDQ